MNKNGFTLMELLFVIVIVALISISSVVVFGNIDDETSAKDRQNIYKDIQKSALLYIDLNDSWLYQFKANGEIKIELSELKNSNYISFDVTDPVTNKEIPSNYMVQIYTAYPEHDLSKKTPYIDTCIVSKTAMLDAYCNKNSPQYDEGKCSRNTCIADSNGLKEYFTLGGIKYASCCKHYVATD